MTTVDNIHTPKAAEVLAARLRSRIVRGEIREGEVLPNEADLCTQFGISRQTLREGLRLLEADGLISIRRGARGGARVTSPTPIAAARQAGLLLQMRGATLEDIYRARGVIEPVAARMLAEHSSPETVDALKASLAASKSSLDDPMGFSRTSSDFHELLVELSGSPTLGLFAAIIAEILRENNQRVVLSRRNHPSQPAMARKAHRAHARLVELVEAGDADGAEELWRKHIAATTPFLLQVLPKDTVVSLHD